MEKTAERQYMVYREKGKLLLRLPGGNIIDYDNRFPDGTNEIINNLPEGGGYIEAIND